jgi:FkbM family methyltransferase
MLKYVLQTAARRAGFDVVRYGRLAAVEERVAFLANRIGLHSILDVGANVGQFRNKVRSFSYQGRVISFEPQQAAHRQLVQSAGDNPGWIIYPRCALGDVAGTAQINLAGNSQSSSLLPMCERHIEASPETRYVGVEQVPVKTLSQVFADDPKLFAGRHVLKMDTQGYELNVLKGAEDILGQIDIVMLEASLVTLYDGEPSVVALLNHMEERQFDCYAICPGFSDPKNFQMLQVDMLFVKRNAME